MGLPTSQAAAVLHLIADNSRTVHSNTWASLDPFNMRWMLLAVAAVMAAMAEQSGRQPRDAAQPCADANNGAEYKPMHQDPQTLYKAAISGDLTAVQQLIQHNPAAVDQRFEQHRTALHGAAKSGHQHMVSLLLSHGAAGDAVHACRLTPLHLAAQHGHVCIAQQLLAIACRRAGNGPQKQQHRATLCSPAWPCPSRAATAAGQQSGCACFQQPGCTAATPSSKQGPHRCRPAAASICRTRC
jgi:hypothetical protein